MREIESDPRLTALETEVAALRAELARLRGDAPRRRGGAGPRLRRLLTPLALLLLGAGLLFAEGAGDPLYIDANGHVGIGTDRPMTRLHVHGTALATTLAASDGLTVDGKAQLNGQVGIGGPPVPDRSLSIQGPGGIGILTRQPASKENEIFFADNGQIRSSDDNHRLIFDRSSNILELREYGEIHLSAGATAGRRTPTVAVNRDRMTVNGRLAVVNSVEVRGGMSVQGQMEVRGMNVRGVMDVTEDLTVRGRLNGQSPPLRFTLSRRSDGKYAGTVRDLREHCGDDDGCRIDVLLRHQNGEPRRISEHLYIAYPRGWRQEDKNHTSFNLQGRDEIFGPWGWAWAHTYKHSWWNNDRTEDLPDYQVGFMSHPHVTATFIVYDS